MNILSSKLGLFSSYHRDRFVIINFLFSLLINIGLWFLLIWQSNNFAELISLHYNIYFGIDLLGPWYRIFLLPSFGLIFLVINFFLGLALYNREKIFSYFLAGTTSLVQIIFILATFFIVLINL